MVTAFCGWELSLPEEDLTSGLLLMTLGFVQVTTNGLIATSEPPAKEAHPGLFPPTFGAVAPFLADLDTTDGLGKVYYREDVSPSTTQLAMECVQRGFPEVTFKPSSVVVVTWENVAPYQGPGKDPAQEDKVSTHPGSSAKSLTCWLCVLWSSGLGYCDGCRAQAIDIQSIDIQSKIQSKMQLAVHSQFRHSKSVSAGLCVTLCFSDD